MPMIITRGAASAQAYGWARRITSGGATIVSLDFVNHRYLKSSTYYDLGTLPGWSYSRSTDANLTTTYVQQSPNIITYSSDLSNAAWTYAQMTYTAGQAAPDGSASAFLISDQAVTNSHTIAYNSISTFSGATIAVSVYLKSNSGQYCQVNVTSNVGGAYFYVTVDLTNGLITESISAGAGSISSSSIAAVPGYSGWYRVNLVGSCTGATAYNFFPATGCNVATGGGNAPSYLGSNSRYVWGPQVEIGSTVNGYIATTTPPPSPLIGFPATVTNLTLFSQLLTNAAWSSTAMTASVSGTAPDGTTTSNLLAETAVTSTHLFFLASNYTVTSGQTITLSAYIKAGTSNLIQLAVINGGNYFYLTFNATTGVITETPTAGTGVYVSSSAVAVNSGWYRVTLTGSITGQTVYGINISGTQTAIGGGLAPSYLGSATNNRNVWGVQFETGSIANPYVPTTSATVSAAIPRITNIGFYDEQQSTNLVTNSIRVGGTNWIALGTVSSSTVTGPDGISNSAVQILATAATSGYYNNNITSVSGTVYTASCYFQYVSGGTSLVRYVVASGQLSGGTGDQYIDFDSNSGSVSFASTFISSYTIKKIGNWYYLTATYTASGSGSSNINLQSTAVGAVNFNVFGVQLEASSVATSYIATGVGSTATRGADVASITYSGGTTGVVTYGAAGSASSGATGSFNLGYSSGGAWINNYVKTLTTS